MTDSKTLNLQQPTTLHDERGGTTIDLLSVLNDSDDSPEIVSSGLDITQCSEPPTIDPDKLLGYKFV